MSPKKKNLDLYLWEIFKEFIALNDKESKKAHEIFKCVFNQIKQKMGEQCAYFNKYATEVSYAGSVYDGVKVSKFDECDMNIVIRLPINYDDGEDGIIIENYAPGYVRLRITRAFDNLDKQKEWETCHKVTREWRDEKKYFLQSKFRQWMHSIVQKALNSMNNEVTVNGVKYFMSYTSSGPAHTLNIRNSNGQESFKLDVDLVPVIRFLLPRWPKGYRTITSSQCNYWYAVPKPYKALKDEKLKSQCWRVSFKEYEREMMKDLKHLKMTIRLVKKLRDALGMKGIASYYIKTIFLWKIQKENDKYWQNKVSLILREVLEDLHSALDKKFIPSFWNKSDNLIENLKPTLPKLYAEQLRKVIDAIIANDIDKVIFSFLTQDEKNIFIRSQFYLDLVDCKTDCSPTSEAQHSGSEGSSQSNHNLINMLMKKIDDLTGHVQGLNDRVKLLEMKNK